jgi:hypothetical protein
MRRNAVLPAIAELPDTPEKIGALQTVALSKTEIAEKAVELLPPSLPAAGQTAFLCEIAEKASSSAAKAAIDKLKRLPVSAPAIESLCAIIRRFVRDDYSPFVSTSVPGRAVDAIRWLDPDMKDPNFVAAILDVLCNASWSSEYEKPANWVFKQLIWMKDKATLDQFVIAEFRRRAMSLPLVYDVGRGGWLGSNRFIVFLEKLKARGGNRAGAALAEIEADLLRRRILAIPNVLTRALSGERYEEVEAMAWELECLARLSVPAAAAALADFKSRPARLLPLKIYKDVDHYDTYDRVTVTETEWVGTETISTAKLGQVPPA